MKTIITRNKHYTYSNVFLYNSQNGERKIHTKTIHFLVASAFVPNPNNYEQVTHIDGDRSNNTTDNLKWIPKKNKFVFQGVKFGNFKVIW